MIRTAGLTQHGSQELSRDEHIRQSVCNLEEIMSGMSEAATTDEELAVFAPLNHYFCKGNYAREIFIRKDTCMIGKIHKHEHINVISKGKCVVVTEDGRETLEAPLTFISKAGIKRAVYAIEDTVWTTIHPTEKTDVDSVEDEVIAKSYEELNRLEYIT